MKGIICDTPEKLAETEINEKIFGDISEVKQKEKRNKKM